LVQTQRNHRSNLRLPGGLKATLIIEFERKPAP
jgi:hypothetical protein